MAKRKTYKTSLDAPDNEAKEPAAVYGEVNLMKQEVIDYVMQLDNQKALERLMKYTRRQKREMEEETIGKEEILRAIEAGLIALKEEREGGKSRFRDLSELLDEL